MASTALTDLGITTTDIANGAYLSASTTLSLDAGADATGISLQVSFYDSSQNLIVAFESPDLKTLSATKSVELKMEGIRVPEDQHSTSAHFQSGNPNLIVKLPADFTVPPVAGTTPVNSVQVGVIFSGAPTGILSMLRTMVVRAPNAKGYQSKNATGYTHPIGAGNKHIPAGGGVNDILQWSADGTAIWAQPAGDATTLNGIASTGFVLASANFAGDLDTVLTNSNFRVDNTATNIPTVSFYAVQVYGNNGNVSGQLATHFGTGDTYTRGFNTVWTGWAKQLSDQNFILDTDYLAPTSTLFDVSDGGVVQGHPHGEELRFTGGTTINTIRSDIGTGGSQVTIEHAGGNGNRHIPSGGNVGQVLENNALGNAIWVNQNTLDAGTLDGIDSTSFTQKAVLETVTSKWVFSNTSGIAVDSGIGGNYESTGSGSTWGATMWAIGASFNGTPSGNTYLPTSLYGTAWIRSTNTEANASVGEGLYIYQNGGYQGGIGTTGIHTNGTLSVDGNIIGTNTFSGACTFNSIVTAASDIELTQGARVFFDGGSNDYIQGDINNNIRTVVVGTERMNVSSSGIQVVGTVSATTIDATSDITKKNVLGVYAPSGIEDIQPYSWTWKSKDLTDKVQVGYIAQHLENIMPESVSKAEDGTLLLNYSAVHTAKIASLEREVFELKQLIKGIVNDRAK